MSGYLNDEAQESEGEEEEYTEKERKKLKKLKQMQSDSSEEEEEDDEEELAEIKKGFINDDAEEEEDDEDDDDDEGRGSEDSDSESKRKRGDYDDDLDENLDDDDLDLIEENMGVKIDRKKKFKRLKRIEDEDSEEEETDARTQIANEIFEGSDEDAEPRSPSSRRADEYASDEAAEESDGEGSFIVDDEGRPLQKQRRKAVFADEGLEAARDIFGCDFDYGEFERYEDWEEGEDEIEEDEYEDEEEDEEGERVVPKKPKVKRGVAKKKSIYDVFEPSELERGHLTSLDHEVQKTDCPERFQTRIIPVTPSRAEGEEPRTTDKELEEEAKWIYYHAFYRPFISNQEGRDEARKRPRRDHRVIQKIYNALDLIRNSTCEIPFIAFYRKEEVQPELNIHDLWKIFKFDEKWCQLKGRRVGFHSLYQKMSEYQTEVLCKRESEPTQDLKVIHRNDISRVESIQTPEEFNDLYKHFLLYYGKDQEGMKEYFTAKNKAKNVRTITKTVKVLRKVKRKKKHKKKANIGDDEDDDEEREKEDKEDADKEGGEEEEEEEVETEVETEVEEEVEDENEADAEEDQLKKPVRRHEYEFLRKAGIGPMVKKFGLTSEQFAENLRDSYQRYEIDQFPEEPMKEAENYVSKICSTAESVLEASIRVVGWQLACEPLVRKTIREVYFERARICVRPTPKGVKLIDEHHPLYAMKYLRDKPVSDLQGDQFLKIKSGVEEKLITFSFSDGIEGHTSSSYLDEVKQLYIKDEFSQVVQDWNELRGRAVEFAFTRIVMDLKRELAQRLYLEAKEHVLEMSCRKLYNWLKIAPYNPGDFSDEDEDDWDTSKGFRVLALAFTPDLSQAAFGCIIDFDGECANFIRLPNLLKRKTSYNERDVSAKEDDMTRLKDYIIAQKPHAVAVSAESREALMVLTDVKEILKELEEQEQFPKINVELLDNELSNVYAVSKKGQLDFIDYPPLLRQAVSLGRRMQDPLSEFSQLCNADDEILNLKYHPLQQQLTPSELLDALRIEFVNRTNEVGVDLNNAVAFPHTQNLVQFVCGLGPRKAHSLIKSMKQSNNRLENRNQLVVNYHMGPKVFINCAGFIKIDTNALGDSDNYIEVLDSTRIHPEAYDWARKMAVDALEYDDDEGKPAEALDEILETPERLSELDLEAFAVELNNQGYGKKNITLYDIRHELNHRYKDFRIQFKSPSSEEIFNMLTKETPNTFYIGKLIQVTVIDFIHRKPRGEQLDNANPVRNEETGLWQCPFCLKNDFPELSEVWNHFDAEDCPGQAVGVRTRLDNGISGFISIKNLSDRTVINPSERVRRQGIVYCRILKIDPEKFSVELTSRSSDLQDVDNKWRLPKDSYYDYSTESKDANKEKKKSEKKKSQYHKRVIAHPSFKNIDYNEAEKLMHTMDQGDAIIRPSSKGVDHLTVTWKVANGVCQHIDVREQDKRNDFSLGQKLWIGHEEFEDLDEILARFVAPMAANSRQILDYKYYKESFSGSKEKAAEYLKEEKKKNAKTIPYVFSCVKILPGKFMISYLPRVKVIHEYVSVLPEGYKFRNNIHSTLPNLLKWFKMNFRAVSKSMATPGRVSSRTPYMGGTTPNLSGIEPSAIHKVAQNLPSHVLHSLSAAASSTPHFGTPFSTTYSQYANTPYTPSGQTPFMTPYATPGPSLTPKYGARTPSQPFPSSQNGGASGGSFGKPRTEGDWQKAAAAWANAQNNRAKTSLSGRTSSTSRRDDRHRITPHYTDDRNFNNRFDATPRSMRSTPKTINSPSNMSIGVDQTPLYDE